MATVVVCMWEGEGGGTPSVKIFPPCRSGGLKAWTSERGTTEHTTTFFLPPKGSRECLQAGTGGYEGTVCIP